MPKLHCDASKESREKDAMENTAYTHPALDYCWVCYDFHFKSDPGSKHIPWTSSINQEISRYRKEKKENTRKEGNK